MALPKRIGFFGDCLSLLKASFVPPQSLYGPHEKIPLDPTLVTTLSSALLKLLTFICKNYVVFFSLTSETKNDFRSNILQHTYEKARKIYICHKLVDLQLIYLYVCSERKQHSRTNICSRLLVISPISSTSKGTTEWHSGPKSIDRRILAHAWDIE